MDFTKEIWHCELYKLQQQAPGPLAIKCNHRIERRPPQFGDEYHGNIDRNETDRILLNCPNGSFLIRDSQRNIGTFTLVIRFDNSNKNYVLYYKPETRQHFVGSKNFNNINDLVQDGLIHMYIETRGASILRQISETKDYESTPFYQSRLHTIQNKTLRQNLMAKQKAPIVSNKYDEKKPKKPGKVIDNYDDSCDSGIFNSLRSNESNMDKPDANFNQSNKTGYNSIDNSEVKQAPSAPPRCKSLYYSLRDKVIPKQSPSSQEKPPTIDSSLTTHYEPIFNFQPVSLDSSISDRLIPAEPNSKSSIKPRSVHGQPKVQSNRYTVIESTNNSFSQLEKNHNFKQHTFVGPQWCDFCAHFMWGLVAQGVQCFDCGFQAHKKCSDKVAADCFPVMKRLKRVFGIELTGLAKMENRAVPIIFEKLIRAVEARDMSLQGIYRISGNIDLIEEVKADLDKDLDSVELMTDPRLVDMETLTGLVKLFLRQLPIPLITSELYVKLLSIHKSESDVNSRRAQIKDSLPILNSVHLSTLEFFIRHLKIVTNFSAQNCMSSSNLAIVFAPTIISKPSSPDMDLSPGMLISRMQSDFKWDSTIVQDLIDGCDSIFSQVSLDEI